MQVGASDFIAVICALIAVAAGSVWLAVRANSALAVARREIDDFKKNNMILLGEKSDLEKQIEKDAERRSDTKPEKINYPKKYLA